MTTRAIRAIRPLLLAAALGLAGCGQAPESTERARGILTGFNLVLAMSVIFLVVAGALVVGAVALDRTLKARRALAEAPAAEEEEDEEVVAGIGVGRAPVPRWLYGFYVVMPLFALLYVLNAVALRPPPSEEPAETEAPTGPVTEVTIRAKSIQFDLALMTFPANTGVTITFSNQDAGIPHNVTLWESEDAAAAQTGKLGETPTFPGTAERTLQWTTPGEGTYYFDCTVHPSMSGDVEVVAAPA